MAREIYDPVTGEWFPWEDDIQDPTDGGQAPPNYGGGDLWYGSPAPAPAPPPGPVTPGPPPPAPPPPPGPGPNPPPPVPPPPGPGPSGGGGRVPGTTEYALPGGRTSFGFPDFAPSPIDYPDWVPPESTIGEFVPPTPTAGEWTPPSWDVGAPPELSPFEYPEFTPPTGDSFQTDPGYDFRRNETLRALRNERSARGLLASPNTLQDLMSTAGSLASQEFGNVFNRQHQGYLTNRDTALAEHDRNEQAKLKRYELLYGAESDEYRRAAHDYATRKAADADALSRAHTIYGTNYQREQDAIKNSLTGYLTGYGREVDDYERGAGVWDRNLAKELSSTGMNLGIGQFNLARDNSRWDQLLGLYGLMQRSLPTYNPMPLPSF